MKIVAEKTASTTTGTEADITIVFFFDGDGESSESGLDSGTPGCDWGCAGGCAGDILFVEPEFGFGSVVVVEVVAGELGVELDAGGAGI
jgi:hypothetical protein